jgi:hypothetical protein
MTVTPAARRLSLLLFAALAVFAFAGAASARSAGIRFVAGAHRVVQGNEASATVSVSPAGARCAAAVRYKGGKTQNLAAATASGGRASWKWKVPRSTPPGPANIYVSCGRAGRASHTFTVIGSVIPPSIHVVKSGWSVRPLPFAGSLVSYGVILANESQQRDAVDVKVLVNFVMADNRLIGSATTRVSDIAAGTEHAMGGELNFPAGAPIARLEIVVTVADSGPASRIRPGLSAVRVMPSPIEPLWAGSVEGEVQNDHPTLTVSQVELSTVVLDADGNVIGGGRGIAAAPLPPASRMFFKISTGMRPIPISRAATALVSVVPTYKKPGPSS